MSSSDVPLESLLHFISSFPPDFLNYGGKPIFNLYMLCSLLFVFFTEFYFLLLLLPLFLGSLRERVEEWLRGYEKQASTSCIVDVKLMKNLYEFPRCFIKHNQSANAIVSYDDEDLEMWEIKAKRWARALFLVIEDGHQLDSLLQVFFVASHL